MFVHCGQTVGRIKMKLRTQVGLSPGYIVLDGDTAPPPPIFGPYQLQSNGCMDQGVIWYGARELHPLQSLVTSVLGHFGPFFKDRNDRGPK